MQRSVILALSAVALGVFAPLACTQNFGQFDATAGGTSGIGSSAGGASGASTSVGGTPTGSSTSGSGGGNASCTPSQCADNNPCTTDLCNLATGACSHEKLDGPQAAVDDKNPCTDDLCNKGVEEHQNVAAGTSCGAGKSACDGNGKCVGCSMASQCPSDECTTPTCDKEQCGTENKPEGTACSTGKCSSAGACVECIGNTDCTGGAVCLANKCTISCTDGAQNGNETDVDCGGGDCPGCATGQACEKNSDCLSDSCKGNKCGN